MQKTLYCILPALMLFPFNTFSQDFTYANVTVKSVSFSNGNLNIRKDDGTGIYAAPQWAAANSIQSPVAYISGGTPMAEASFSMDCAIVPAFVFIRGMGSDSINFPSVKVTVAPSSNTIHSLLYPATGATKPFASGTIRFFNPFSINWEISFDNGLSWRAIGSTKNTLYVTRTAPQTETSEYKWFHTVFDLSCRNAQHKTTDTDIISNVWNEFTDHVVLNYKGDSLFYYKAMNSPNVTLASLLKYKDAECYTFAQLFLAAIKIQGVVRTNNYVYITPVNNTVCGRMVNRFIVKDWTFGTPSASANCPDFPYKNTYTTLLPAPYTSYNFTTADVTDKKGIPGSCTANPSSYFNNHQIAKIDGKYYDPCYGVTFNTLGDIKTAAFSGWSYRFANGTGMTEAYFTNDLSKSDLSETINTF